MSGRSARSEVIWKLGRAGLELEIVQIGLSQADSLLNPIDNRRHHSIDTGITVESATVTPRNHSKKNRLFEFVDTNQWPAGVALA